MYISSKLCKRNIFARPTKIDSLFSVAAFWSPIPASLVRSRALASASSSYTFQPFVFIVGLVFTHPKHKLMELDTSVLPQIVLIAPPPKSSVGHESSQSLCAAWRTALQDIPEPIAARFTVKETRLDPELLSREYGAFDCLVSPANSFGIMDGGYVYCHSQTFL